MSLSGVSKEAVVGTTVLGVAFASGILVGRKYYAWQSRSKKAFEREGDPGRDYASKHSLREHPQLKKLRQCATKNKTLGSISCDEAQFLTNLAKLIMAKKVLTVGDPLTYLSLSLALALRDDAKVLCCHEAIEDARIGQPFWAQAGVQQKIGLRIKPTTHTLDELLQTGDAGTYDVVCLNISNQPNPNECYEKSVRLVRPGGIVALDGVLCRRRVLNIKKGDVPAELLHELNEKLLRDVRVNISILPLGDGLTLAFKLLLCKCYIARKWLAGASFNFYQKVKDFLYL